MISYQIGLDHVSQKYICQNVRSDHGQYHTHRYFAGIDCQIESFKWDFQSGKRSHRSLPINRLNRNTGDVECRYGKYSSHISSRHPDGNRWISLFILNLLQKLPRLHVGKIFNLMLKFGTVAVFAISSKPTPNAVSVSSVHVSNL